MGRRIRRQARPPNRSNARAVGPGGPVVGIGASAGGLEAFKKFFSAMPPDSGMAFVLVPHLDPMHESLMVELLARYTKMPVREARERMRVEPNSVYVIPPNQHLAIDQGALHLSKPPAPRGRPTAIDFFLRSLAEDQRENAIGIVLSGTGTHGALGLKEIKLRGGMAIAQAPESADYDQMPQSAIATGLVDYVLPPEAMPQALVTYARHRYFNKVQVEPEANHVLSQILAILRSRTQFDFGRYRKKMLLRRIQRRMGLNQIEDPASYLERLREDPGEAMALYRDLLIGVTRFFRDAAGFDVLAQEVIAELVAHSARDIPLRVWVPGCATGEEAYSIAILVSEGFGAARRTPNFQIFATDIDEASLEVARQGLYPESIASDVGPERLERFFTKADDDHYLVIRQIREAFLFARQNLLADAPFSKLDLVSCRNLLIYLEPETQAKLIGLFHFALKPGGYLMLGPSESVERETDLFEPISKKWRIYRRIGSTRPERVDIPILPGARGWVPAASVEPRTNVVSLMERHLPTDYAPAAVLIDDASRTLCYHGPIVNYLEFPAGEPTRDLLAMVRPGLRTRLRVAIQKASRENATAVDADCRVKRDGAYVPCVISVSPLREEKESSLFLVTFRDLDRARAKISVEAAEPLEESSLVRQLEYELKTTRDDLQSTIEELESANEELKASNEEVMSMNEELQSANEELETSKEELQSLNEELSTVDAQLQDKVEQLERLNDDVVNLMSSTEMAAIFLDPNGNIQRFTPPATRLLNLLATDVGRPITDLSLRFTDDTLLGDVSAVMERLTPLEKDVSSADGRSWLRRILPYRTADRRVTGVVITFVDITERKRIEAALSDLNAALEQRVFDRTRELQLANERLAQSERRFRLLADNVPDLFAYVDAEERYLFVNKGYAELFQTPSDELVGCTMREVIGENAYAHAKPHIGAVLSGKKVHFERPLLLGDDSDRWVSVRYVPDFGENGAVSGFYTHMSDVTDRKAAERALEENRDRLEAIVNTAVDAIITIDESGIIESFNPAAERLFGYSAGEAIGQNVKLLMPDPYRSEHSGYLRRYLENREPRIIGIGREAEARRKDGSTFPVELAVSEISHLRRFTGIIRDITARKRIQNELRSLSARLLTTAESERRTIARELHDDFSQRLAMLSVEIEILGREHPELSRRLDEIGRRVAGLSEDVHRLAYTLHPSILDHLGLSAALRRYVEDVSPSQGIEVVFRERGFSGDLDAATSSCLYRIAQEALTNVARHSKRARATVRLVGTAQTVRLSVRDSGQGFDLEEVRRRGPTLGFTSMEERVRLVGGTLAIQSRPGQGTIIKVTCPRKAAHE